MDKKVIIANTYSLPQRSSFLSKEMYYTYIQPRINNALRIDGDIPGKISVNLTDMSKILKTIFPLNEISSKLLLQIPPLYIYRFYIKSYYTGHNKALLDFSVLFNF